MSIEDFGVEEHPLKLEDENVYYDSDTGNYYQKQFVTGYKKTQILTPSEERQICIYFNTYINSIFSPFITIQNSVIIENQVKYSFGWNDFPFVCFSALMLTAVRYILSVTIFPKIATRFEVYDNEVEDEKIVTTYHKCIEQEWLVLYYLFSFTFGFRIIKQEMNLSLDNMWIGYPFKEVSLQFKLFYLIQLSFYFHQIVVITVEKHRKDYKEMIAHHCIAISLIILSIWTNFTRIGVVFLATFDVTDILLPLSKMMEYGYQVPIGYITFAVFFLLWFFTRHVWFFFIIYNLNTKAEKLIDCVYSIQERCFNAPRSMKLLFNTILFCLQALQLFWFKAICNLIYKKIFLGIELGDDRSDDEDENEDENEYKEGQRRDISPSPLNVNTKQFFGKQD
ncbi:hypothetical protein WA158_006498 [Blastocystis sp. Blastoise]